MTMTREAKATHTRQLATTDAQGYTGTRFASPIDAARVFPARGHYRMTAAEYRETRMHRGQMAECRLDLVVQERRERRRRTRCIGGRRTNGQSRGFLGRDRREEVARVAHMPAPAYVGRRRALELAA